MDTITRILAQAMAWPGVQGATSALHNLLPAAAAHLSEHSLEQELS